MSSLKLSNDSGIYMITCTANGKIYIGSTVCLRRRWNNHLRDLSMGRHSNGYLQRAWNKYGEQSFTITVLEKCDRSLLGSREQFYLDHWLPFQERGFNIALDAKAPMRGRKALPETRAKMSDYAKNRSPEHRAALSTSNKGKKLSPKTRAKISAAQIGRPGTNFTPEIREKIRLKATGRKMSPEAIAKIAAANRGRKQTPEHIAKCAAARMGHECSPETRAKISAANSGKKRTAEMNTKNSERNCKYSYILISPNKEQFEFKNLMQFCREQGLDFRAMYKVASGERKHYKGWIVRRIKNNESQSD